MNEAKATRYQRLRRRVTVAGAVSGGLMLATLVFTPLASVPLAVARRVESAVWLPAASLFAAAAFVSVTVALWELAMLPVVVYSTLRVDSTYGSRRAGVHEVLAAQTRATAVVLSCALAWTLVVLLTAHAFGSFWWLISGVVFGLFMACALHGGPFLLGALAEVRPLSRPSLVARVSELASRARVPVAGIDEWIVDEGSAVSAMVAGAGRSRRVLVARPLVRDWSDEEVAVVVAHELSHHAHGDLWQSLALDVVSMTVALGCAQLALVTIGAFIDVTSAEHLEALPLLSLVATAAWLALAPFRHALSRRHERRADVFALALTNGAEAFQTAVKRLGARHLAEEHPSPVTRWLFSHHPSVSERLALAEAYRRVRMG